MGFTEEVVPVKSIFLKLKCLAGAKEGQSPKSKYTS